ncbi:protein-N(pi)-phosphohistidine--sugar phosphotransferase (plasmid) [Maritalea myrionectae]|uniref:Protein-N(Pi)-phosphohistidine--sugar phosphotransferase n=1 Tax=Maritalea myrionectae TaxID=454601 RepID=A0A2R4MJE4_9HYPH|nr:PTS sugar transporter subunit IIA [Maritalea myrionectae]AVX06103.1 protein-N(pi)-phosphohistidine--sugar phosphotransferase [Maritalea myrionectae]
MAIIDESFELDFAIDTKSQSRKATFWALGDRIACLRDGSSSDDIAMYIWLRDRLGSVAIGHGVAIPQVVFPMHEKPLLCVTRLNQPVAFGGPMENHQVDLIFAIAGNPRDQGIMLRLIGRCELMAQNRQVLQTLRKASSQPEIEHIFARNNAQLTQYPAAESRKVRA